jgi:hypothetical protein
VSEVPIDLDDPVAIGVDYLVHNTNAQRHTFERHFLWQVDDWRYCTCTTLMRCGLWFSANPERLTLNTLFRIDTAELASV